MPILNLPLISQWGVSANRYRNDCGVACVAMLLEYYAKRGISTVDSLASETGLKSSDDGLLPAQLVALAARHDLPGVAVRAGLDDIRAAIDDNRPVIALVAYRFILGRLDQADNVPGQDGHYVVVVGYDDGHFVLDDPDYWVPHVERGHNYLCPVTELDRAMAEHGYQAVLVEVERMSAADQIVALAKQAQGLLDEILVLADDVQPEPPPVDTVAVVVKANSTNIRSQPTTNSSVVAVVNAGVILNVVDAHVTANGYQWYQIIGGQYNGWYIAQSVVSPKA
jgi:uncharacterized protein YvpB